MIKNRQTGGTVIHTLAGVTGWPVHHSLSPVIHNTWLKTLGLNGGYTMFAVHPDEAVRAFQSLKRTSIKGVNVTLPLKSKAYEAADELSEDARKLGVCNLLYQNGDRLIGHNTDMEGFAEPLLSTVGHRFVLNSTSVIIGSGGAARAVLGALMAIGAPEIRIINRTDSKANALVEHVNLPNFIAYTWDKRDDALYGAGLVVNATSAGMKGYPELDVDLEYVSPGAVIYDLVYTPQETGLLKQAISLGLQTISGLDMLIAQARPSFRLLFGEDPPADRAITDIVRQRLLDSL